MICKPAQLKAGSWHHVALIRNDSQWQLFVDQRLHSSLEVSQPVNPSELSFRVGMGLTLVDRCFLGEIDELRVYRGVPRTYREQTTEDQVERAVWSSFARLLLTSNDFLYVD